MNGLLAFYTGQDKGAGLNSGDETCKPPVVNDYLLHPRFLFLW